MGTEVLDVGLCEAEVDDVVVGGIDDEAVVGFAEEVAFGAVLDRVSTSWVICFEGSGSAGVGMRVPPTMTSRSAIGDAIFQFTKRQTITAPPKTRASPSSTPPIPLPSKTEPTATMTPRNRSIQPRIVTHFLGAGRSV